MGFQKVVFAGVCRQIGRQSNVTIAASQPKSLQSLGFPFSSHFLHHLLAFVLHWVHLCLEIHCVSDFPGRWIKLANTGSRNPPTTALPPVLYSPPFPLFPPLHNPLQVDNLLLLKMPACIHTSTFLLSSPATPLLPSPLLESSPLYATSSRSIFSI